MKLVYYPDHAERYTHIPNRLRRLYPDEIHIGSAVIKRIKTFKEITGEDIKQYGVPACLIAKDVPYTEGLCRC